MMGMFLNGGIAQLARASALQAEGRRFDSDYLHHLKIKHLRYFRRCFFLALVNKSENKMKTESAQSKESCTIFGTGFSDVTRGSGVWPESRVGCGATLKNFLHLFQYGIANTFTNFHKH